MLASVYAVVSFRRGSAVSFVGDAKVILGSTSRLAKGAQAQAVPNRAPPPSIVNVVVVVATERYLLDTFMPAKMRGASQLAGMNLPVAA